MNDLAPPRLFLDAALIVAALIVAALFSADAASPGRRLFKMGEVGLVHLYVSDRVVGEAQGVLQQLTGHDYDTIKVLLAENLVLANVVTASTPDAGMVRACLAITRYRPDAEALAAAMERDCEVFVTYDRQHLLQNPEIGPPQHADRRDDGWGSPGLGHRTGQRPVPAPPGGETDGAIAVGQTRVFLSHGCCRPVSLLIAWLPLRIPGSSMKRYVA